MQIIIEKEKSVIPVDKLMIRYLPIITPTNVYKNNLMVINSPQYDVIYLLAKHGLDMTVLLRSRYAKVAKHEYVMGLRKFTPVLFADDLLNKLSLYKTISKKGVPDKPKIVILRKPIWNTRFSCNEINGLEVWSGLWVCICAHLLNIDSVKGYYAIDKYPGTGKKIFKNKYNKVEGLWD